MTELMEIIEDLETLEVLHDGGGKDAHIEYLLKKISAELRPELCRYRE